MRILVVYYSTFGNTYKMAQEVCKGVEEVNAEALLRRCPELIPESILHSRPDMQRGMELQRHIPTVTLDDFREAQGYIFGTPTRFGSVAAQLKNVLDQLGPLWTERVMEGKPAGVFTSTSTLHGGQEATIFSVLPVLFHLGCIVVGVPYSVQELFTTQGGGSPYGPGHLAGTDNTRDLDLHEAHICRAFGRRIAELAWKLLSG